MERSEILSKFSPERDNLLGILHAIQNNSPQNYITSEDMADVARYLNTTYSHVYGVATYYTMYSITPRGRYLVRVCNSPVCNMEGAPRILALMQEILGVEKGGTTPDGKFTLEVTECLGRCSVAPSMMVGEDIYGELDRGKIESILANYK